MKKQVNKNKDIKACVSVFINYNPLNKDKSDLNKIKGILKAYEKK